MLEPRQFIIHGDTNGLKDARKVWRAAAGAEHRADGIDEIIGGRERAALPSPHDLAGHASRARFVGVGAQQCRQIDFVDRVQQLTRVGIGIRTHPHVERRALAEREAAGEIVELMRRHAEVEENAVEALVGRQSAGVERGIVGEQGAELSGAFKIAESLARGRERPRIAIDAGDTHTAFEKGGGVPTTTQGAIEDGRGAGEQRFDLGQEHWDVVGANAPGWESTDRAHALIEGLLGRVMLVRC